MSNIHIPGESIKTAKDAEKCFKDNEMEVASDGWQEHEAIMAKKDKKYNKEMHHALKSCCVYGRYIGFNWAPGQYEAIFGDGGRENEK